MIRKKIEQFFLWTGLVARNRRTGKIDFPFNGPPMWVFEGGFRALWAYMKFHGAFYVFRNKHVNGRAPGRLLPWRWGFGIYGFEFGDRGH